MSTRDRHEVVPGLWQGGRPTDSDDCRGFDLVVLCAIEDNKRPPRYRGRTLHAEMHDGSFTPGEEASSVVAGIVASRIVAQAVKDGQRVLVTCAAGLNRSGLVSALSLLRMGHSPSEAVMLVRHARGQWALSNKTFERVVMDRTVRQRYARERRAPVRLLRGR